MQSLQAVSEHRTVRLFQNARVNLDDVIRTDPDEELVERRVVDLAEGEAIVDRGVARFVREYNPVRMHSAICSVTPEGWFLGRETAIATERGLRLEATKERRRQRRQCV